MYVVNPVSLTELYVENASMHNKYSGLLNANFQDYIDALRLGGEFKTKLSQLQQRVAALGSAAGIAAGSLGGPVGMAAGFTVGNVAGKYIGNILGYRIYGQALEDMTEIAYEARLRHSQLAASLAFVDQIDGAIDTLRQNENKRIKDAMQGMSV